MSASRNLVDRYVPSWPAHPRIGFDRILDQHRPSLRSQPWDQCCRHLCAVLSPWRVRSYKAGLSRGWQRHSAHRGSAAARGSGLRGTGYRLQRGTWLALPIDQQVWFIEARHQVAFERGPHRDAGDRRRGASTDTAIGARVTGPATRSKSSADLFMSELPSASAGHWGEARWQEQE